MLLGTQSVNGDGRLEIGGCDTVELAREFGTPLYVLDEACLRESCRAYRRAIESRYPKSLVSFAGKAFLNLAICRIVEEEGLGLDVCSAGELHTAQRAEFPAERITFHGNNKSSPELRMAVGAGVGRLCVDSAWELEQLQAVAAEMGRTADILLRITPGVRPDTHTFIQAGQVDSKFGLGIVSGAAMDGIAQAERLPNVRLRGLHCHIGSQIFDLAHFAQAARLMMELFAQIKVELGVTLEDLNLGGGLGVRYRSTDRPPSVDQYAEAITGEIRTFAQRKGFAPPRLGLEPGRSIVGEAGTTLYTVGAIKEIPGLRTYVSVDGGLSDNPRPALYQAVYEAIVANKANRAADSTVTVVGKHCETDLLISDLAVPRLAPGDLLAVQTTGAYNCSMASNYNRLPRPAVVLVSEGRAELAVARETLEDLLRCDRLPERLRKNCADSATKG
jgi:diaminopimelate decarboxylase